MARYEIVYGTVADSKTGEAQSAGAIIELDTDTAQFLGPQVEYVGPSESPDANANANANADANNEQATTAEDIPSLDLSPDTGTDADTEAGAETGAGVEADTASEDIQTEADDAIGGMDDFTTLSGIGPERNDALHDAGYTKYADIASATADELASAIDGISQPLAEDILEAVSHDSNTADTADSNASSGESEHPKQEE